MELETILNKIYVLPPEAIQAITECVSVVDHPKGHILLKENKIENNIFLIKKGIVRAYSVFDGTEVTFWFGKEGDPVISMKSYVEGKKGYESIELLEDSTFYKINSKNLQRLFIENTAIANWGRKFAELELIKTEERLISLQFKNASQRYSDLINQNSEIIKRVPLGIIASYLGITQVSLSRIRAEVK